MKKSVLLFTLLLLLTGCSSTISYNFTKDNIGSNIEINLSNKDIDNMTKELKFENGEITDYEGYIKDMINSSSIIAFDKNEYKNISYKKNNDNYKIEYSYDFDYESFKNNYYLNNCFDYYIHTEDSDFHYYNISGNYNCNYENVKLLIKGNVANSNSNNVKKNVHTFDILKTDNNIEFAISKNDINNKSIISKWKIIAGITILILIIITVLLMKKIEE